VKKHQEPNDLKKKFTTDFGFEKVELLQLVSEHLAWILRIIDIGVVPAYETIEKEESLSMGRSATRHLRGESEIYFRMVCTRQGTQIEPPSLERKNEG